MFAKFKKFLCDFCVLCGLKFFGELCSRSEKVFGYGEGLEQNKATNGSGFNMSRAGARIGSPAIGGARQRGLGAAPRRLLLLLRDKPEGAPVLFVQRERIVCGGRVGVDG